MKGLEKYFVEIEEWLKNKPLREEDNRPLVLAVDDNLLTKTLVVQWIYSRSAALQGQNYPDIVIPHFASAGGNNSNYFYTIYRILIKLRVALRHAGQVQHQAEGRARRGEDPEELQLLAGHLQPEDGVAAREPGRAWSTTGRWCW